jgi:EAL domain-containing protein (putative c-di-GMP-specific phosphodiesterase class I)
MAVDNFGAGCSSLSNVKQFPIDTIKTEASSSTPTAIVSKRPGLTHETARLAGSTREA